MDWQNGIVFLCPCDDRRVYITSPPHSISFDAGGVLTLEPSCGYLESKREDGAISRPQNWCHFWMTDGQPEMCSDAKCPGASL